MMRTLRIALLLVCGLALIQACSGKTPIPNPDAGPVQEVEYDGPGSPGVIPVEVPEDPPVVVDEGDAGEFVEDPTCCPVTFSLVDLEPAGATGRVRGFAGPLLETGLALARANGKWTATACMPARSATRYWYELSWPAGPDAGTDAPEADAALPDDATTDSGPAMHVVVRYAEDQPLEYDGNGNPVNFYAAACGNDAGR